jgi:segregation and condensation protein A
MSASPHSPSAPSDFVVELPLFNGPFRLLAELLLEQKIDVCDVPVARVTDRFLRRGLDAMEAWSLEEATWFVAVCAMLLELKVGRLLPRAPVDSEEDLLGGASPDLIYARSVELAAFRRVAGALSERIAAEELTVPRAAGPPAEFASLYPDIMERVTVESLGRIAAGVFGEPVVIDLTHVTPIRITVRDALRTVIDQLAAMPEARFRDLLTGCTERIEVVVRFLALLELYREGKVELSQSAMFGDIAVRWQGGPSTSHDLHSERDIDE